MEKEKIGCPITLGEYEKINKKLLKKETKHDMNKLKEELENIKFMIDELEDMLD